MARSRRCGAAARPGRSSNAILGGKANRAGDRPCALWGLPSYFGHPAHAADAGGAHSECVNPLNTAWTLSAAFPRLLHAGRLPVLGGRIRAHHRETVNVLLEGIVDTCLCGALFWAFGFAFMFGAGNGFIGLQYFFLHGAPETYGATGRADRGLLAVSVRLRRHLQHHHLGGDGGADVVRGRSLVQHRRQRVHLSDLRPLAWGPGRLAQQHPPGAVPRLRRVDGGAHHRRLHRAGRGDGARTAARPQVRPRRRQASWPGTT